MPRSLIDDFLKKRPKKKVLTVREKLELAVARERIKASKRETKQSNILENKELIKEFLRLKFKDRVPKLLSAGEKAKLKKLGATLKREGVPVAKLIAKAGLKGGGELGKFLFLSPAARKKFEAEQRRRKKPSRKPSVKRAKKKVARKKRSKSKKR